jgi:hypothetical protein
MSDLNDFLRAAKVEAEEQRFQRDHAAGLIPVSELIGRVRFVGGGLAVPYQLYQLSDQDFQAYYSNRSFDFDSKPEPPPPIS